MKTKTTACISLILAFLTLGLFLTPGRGAAAQDIASLATFCAAAPAGTVKALLAAARPGGRDLTPPVRQNGRNITSASELRLYDRILFGSYPQGAYGSEAPIEWYVIGKSGNSVTLLARYGLDSRPYHSKNRSVTWQNSELYRWLNREFKDAAFTYEQQQSIPYAVTLLSAAEAGSLPADCRMCVPTDYAIACGGSEDRCIWWLRDFSGTVYYCNRESANCAAAVSEWGEVVQPGFQINFHHKYVRPVVTIQF